MQRYVHVILIGRSNGKYSFHIALASQLIYADWQIAGVQLRFHSIPARLIDRSAEIDTYCS